VKIVWTRTARRGLEHLHAYVLEHDPAAADRMAAAIHDSVETLTQFPARGRPGRVPGTRELVVVGTPFLVPYKLEGERLEIIAVLHGARRWPPD
jgi:plasmid stabilization system protein ParE